jgi:hypothetical protein
LPSTSSCVEARPIVRLVDDAERAIGKLAGALGVGVPIESDLGEVN